MEPRVYIPLLFSRTSFTAKADMSSQNSTLGTLIMQNRVATANNLAGITLMVYETLCTLDKEIRLVWLAPWSLMNIIHLVIRYYAIVLLLINVYAFGTLNLSNKLWVSKILPSSLITYTYHLSSCERFNIFQTWGAGAFIPVMNIALLLRIFALYGQNSLMGALLVVLWLVETSCLFIFMGEAFSSPQMLANPWPHTLPGCFPLKPASYAMIIRSGAISVAFQCLYLVITLRKKNYRVNTHPMLKVFFRDSLIYCISILGFSAVYAFEAILVKLLPPGILQNIGVTWIMAVLPIVTGRLILNLKHVGQKSLSSVLPSSGADNDPVLFTSVIPVHSFSPS